MIACPRIDERDADELVRQLRTMLRFYVPEVAAEEGANPQVDAMVNIAARFGVLTIDRLNRAPMKNMLAFLSLAGITPLPPRAARVPLTFYLSTQNPGAAVVPARTQVAAELAKGETKPVLFETENELVIVAARLASLLVKNVAGDRYRDWTSVVGPATPPESGSAAASLGSSGGRRTEAVWQALPHVLSIGIPVRELWPPTNELRLRFILEESDSGAAKPQQVQWELYEAPVVGHGPAGQSVSAASPPKPPSGAALITPVMPDADETEGMTRSGTVTFRNLRQPRPVGKDGFFGTWLCCRLLTPMTRDSKSAKDALQADPGSTIKEIWVETEFEEELVAVDNVVAGGALVDATKDFFPFGERPAFGSTMYVGSKAFSDPDALVTVRIEITNPADSDDSPIPPVARQDAQLGWEYWNGKEWRVVGTANTKPAESVKKVRFARDQAEKHGEREFVDTTQAFTDSGVVSFGFDAAPVESTMLGKKAYWIRVRILAGGYGREAGYTQDPQTGQYTVTPATYAPPSIRTMTVGIKVSARSQPAAIGTLNDFVTRQIAAGTPFQPFIAAEDDPSTTIYLGFLTPTLPAKATPSPELESVPDRQALPTRSMSLYVGLDHGKQTHGPMPDPLNQEPPKTWEYWNGAAWTRWTVRDGTQGFERTGILRLLAPLDYRMSEEFGLNRYWLRMRKEQAAFDPEIGRVLLNTTMAREGATLYGEVLGTGTAQAGQVLRTAQSPVLSGQQLEVREPCPPTKEEERRLLAEEGPDAIRPATLRDGLLGQVWTRWHEVSDLNNSGARDRHYTLDCLRGEVRFGDGINGMIPQPLPGNIRMASYRTGGGLRGNKPSLTIRQMKSAVPYVQKVVNWEEAVDGEDPESTPTLLERGPRRLRHGNRAVTAEDFEDLAIASSWQVARAKCLPLCDLELVPASAKKVPGVVSVIIVPRSTETAPVPSEELLESVRTSLLAQSSPMLRLVVKGPDYRTAEVETEIVIDDPERAGEIELAVTLALKNLLHPVTGGKNGTGWDFARRPQRSDLWRLIEDIRGISHVRRLSILLEGDPPPGDPKPAIPVAGGGPEHWLIRLGKLTVVTTLED